MNGLSMNGVTVVIGVQWGDEGKGKLVDNLGRTADIVARCQGGANAGHTVVVKGEKFDFHILPSGLINPNTFSVIGHGLVVYLPAIFSEGEQLEKKGITDWKRRLWISDRAHLVFDFHKIVDGLKEQELGRGSLGTTRQGIGPAYSSKASRSGLRVHHLFQWEEFESQFRVCVKNRQKRYGHFDYDVESELKRYKIYAEQIRPMVIDTITYLSKAITLGKKVLVEGANATMLDLDFGTYPYVTSSSTCVGGACTGLGIPPSKIGSVLGVCKAYTTRVGDGPFPTELKNDLGDYLRERGHEYGVTTGRARRCGWLDMVVIRYSHMVNDYTSLCLTKLDVLDTFKEIKIAIHYRYQGQHVEGYPADLTKLNEVEVEYETLPGWQQDITHIRRFEDLPIQAQTYIRRVEHLAGIKIQSVGVGPERDALIML